MMENRIVEILPDRTTGTPMRIPLKTPFIGFFATTVKCGIFFVVDAGNARPTHAEHDQLREGQPDSPHHESSTTRSPLKISGGATRWRTGLMSQEDHSTEIQRCIDRLGARATRQGRKDELVARASERLTRLTRKMLRDRVSTAGRRRPTTYPGAAVMRLCRALGEVQPLTVADFFRLAAAQIRRELIDLASSAIPRPRLGCQPRRGATRGGGARGRDLTHRHHPRPRPPGRVDRLSSRGRALPPEQPRGVRPAVLPRVIPGRGSRRLGRCRNHDQLRRWRAARMRLVETLGGRLPGLSDAPSLRGVPMTAHNDADAIDTRLDQLSSAMGGTPAAGEVALPRSSAPPAPNWPASLAAASLSSASSTRSCPAPRSLPAPTILTEPGVGQLRAEYRDLRFHAAVAGWAWSSYCNAELTAR